MGIVFCFGAVMWLMAIFILGKWFEAKARYKDECEAARYVNEAKRIRKLLGMSHDINEVPTEIVEDYVKKLTSDFLILWRVIDIINDGYPGRIKHDLAEKVEENR